MLQIKSLFACAALCAGLSLGSVAARADSVSISVDSTTPFAASSFSLVNGVSYVLTLSDQWAGNGGVAIYSLSFVSTDSSVYKMLMASSGGGASGEKTQSVSFTYTGATDVDNSILSLVGSFHTLPSGRGGFSSSATATLASVPGPVAGAGAPALLGLAGLAGWRRRRRAA